MNRHCSIADGETLINTALRHATHKRVTDGFWMADAQGRLLEVNEACCQMCGINEDELLGMRITELYATVFECDVTVNIEKILDEGADRFETRFLLKDGSIVDVEVSIQYSNSEGGRFISFQRDITDAKRSEKLLHLFKGSMEESSDAIGMSTPEGRHFYQNEAFNNLFGEIGESPPATVYVDENVGKEVFNTIMAGGRWDGEVEMYAKDRSVLNIFLRAYANRDANGRIIGLVGINSDITERKRAEDALRESEAFIKAVMDNLPIGIAVNSVDPSVSFQYMNDNFPKFYQTTRQALASPDAFWSAVYEDPEFRELIKARVLADCASGDPERMHWVDVPIARRGKETSYIEVRNTPLPSKRLMVSTVWDVTGRMKAEKEREQFFKFFLTSADLMVIADPNGAFLKVNPACGTTLGYSEVELVSKSFVEFIHPDDKQATLDEMALQQQRGTTLNFENRYLCKDGSVRWLSWRATYVKEEGITYASARDTTEMRHMEQILRSKRELLQKIFDTIPVMITIHNPGLNEFSVNREFERVIGYTNEEIESIDLLEICYPDPAVRQRAVEFMNSLNSHWADFPITTKNGNSIETTWTNIYLLDNTHVGIGVDISGRKQAEEAIKRANIALAAQLKFNEALLGSLPIPVFFKDVQGCYIGCNQAFTDVMGVSREEIVGKKVHELWPSEQSLVYHEQDMRLLADPRHQHYDFKVTDKNGRKLSVIFEKDVFYNEQGEPAGIVGSFLDITDRKDAEEKIRQSEEKFSTAFRMSPDAINITRLDDGKYLEVNEGFTALTGYTPEDAIGKTALEINIWANPEDRARLVHELKAHGVVLNLESQFIRKDSSILTGYMSARVIAIEGAPCLLSITRDISDRKRAEEYLRESEANLRTVLDSMPAGVWWFDKDGNIEYLNRCFVDQFGYTLEDIPSLNNWFLNAYPDAEYRNSYISARNAAIDETLTSGSTVSPREAKITCKNGSTRHVIINTQFILGRTIEIFTDITDREHYHEQLQKVDKLESLGVLAGGIAHDFNNILTGIVGNISFARTLLDESHKSAVVLLNAEKAANRAADLAHQLLTFAKGGQPIKKVVSVRHLLEDSTSFVLRGSNVTNSLELPDDLPAVEVDEGQLSQVINNLIINASQAMPGGGTVTIRGETAKVDAANNLSLPPGDYLRLTFTDTGCGMSQEVQKKVFDPYFTTKAGGSGLGLASAHSIIIKHGGYIGVCSDVSKGTTFELLLPASEMQAAPTDLGAETALFGELNNSRVLVMDDEETIRDLVSLMLDSLGYLVHTCADGTEAIALYKAASAEGQPYSAVIMDLTIPGGMGGREAAQHILAFDPNARLVVSSGYSTDPIMSEFADFGFCATLLKPYTMNDISKTTKAVLSTRDIR